jgi:uncharacterized protein (TIGR02271 family)
MTSEQAARLAGGNGNVLDTSGDKIGSIGQVYLDDSTGEPSWVTVKTGLFGTSESFVPLQDARVDGDDVVVPFDKDTVKGAPRIDADNNLSPAEEDNLYTYYNLGGTGTTGTDTTRSYDDQGTAQTGTYAGGDDKVGRRDYDDDTVGRRDYDENAVGRVGRDDTVGRDDNTVGRDDDTVGRDTSGPTTDNAMTRSEEQLRVGTQTREAGRARLRKYVVTENVTQTVPVQREEVRLEREPITDANVGEATSGPDISEEVHEVTLHEERPVVEKEAVPVERVRMDKDTVTEQQTVSDEVRKEQIDVDGDGDVRR